MILNMEHNQVMDNLQNAYGTLRMFYVLNFFVHKILGDHSNLVDEIDPTDLVEETEMLQTPQQ